MLSFILLLDVVTRKEIFSEKLHETRYRPEPVIPNNKRRKSDSDNRNENKILSALGNNSSDSEPSKKIVSQERLSSETSSDTSTEINSGTSFDTNFNKNVNVISDLHSDMNSDSSSDMTSDSEEEEEDENEEEEDEDEDDEEEDTYHWPQQDSVCFTSN